MDNIAERLRDTEKGKLRYHRELGNEQIKSLLDEISSLPVIHVPARVLQNLRSQTSTEIGKENVEHVQDKEQRVVFDEKARVSVGTSVSDFRSQHERSCQHFSEEYGRSRLAITKYEDELRHKARESVLKKQKQFDDVLKRLELEKERKCKEIERKAYLDNLRKTQDLEVWYESQEAEIARQQKRLKDEHDQRKQIQDAKLQEAEHTMQKLHLEEMSKRVKENRARQERLSKCVNEVIQLITKAHDDLTGHQYQNHISDVARHCMMLLQSLVDKAEAVRTECQQTGVVNIDQLEECKLVFDQACKAYEVIKKELERAEEAGKEDEAEKQRQARIEQEQSAAVRTPLPALTPSPQPECSQKSCAQAQITTSQISAVVASRGESLCVDIDGFRQYTDLQNKLMEVEKSTAVLSSTPELKKFKFDIMKAANTPINAISPHSGNHLRDKLKRLLMLLSCQPVEVSGRTVRLDQHSQGPLFCKNLIAKMIVKKGQEQVTSKHESAFAIGMVAVGLWRECISIGELLLAHFYAQCPYLIPYYIPRQNGHSDEDYFKSRGYRYEDGVVEKHDMFLKRTSGITRLYFSIIISTPPRGDHPHGIEYAWRFLARVLNINPEPDITCIMIYDCLQVTGNALYQVYHDQFLKLLHVLMKEMLPKLKDVSTDAGSGSLTRLQVLLETSVMRHGNIPLPDGFLEKNFWLS